MNDSDTEEHVQKRLSSLLADPAQVQRILEKSPAEMNLSESAYYIAGYCRGYDIGKLKGSKL